MSLRVAEGVEVFDVDPVREREAWLELRRGGITASAVAALLSQHPYTSIQGEIDEKIAPTPDKPSSYMLAGRYQEYAIAARLAAEHPDWVIEDPRVFVRDRATMLGATVDRTIESMPLKAWLRLGGRLSPERHERASKTRVVRIVAEFKSVEWKRWDGWAKQPPVHAALQATTGAMLLDADGAIVVAEQRSGFGLGNQAIHAVSRVPAWERTIRRRAAQFKKRLEHERARKGLKHAG